MGCDFLVSMQLTLLNGFNPRTHMRCDRAAFHRASLHVSIHAPTWGATLATPWYTSMSTSFNPSTHMGCDKDDSYCLAVFIVSIHAPTWGATDTSYLYLCACKFQSTHPHGVRQSARLIYCSLPSFNPRTHMGCDAKSFL